jgi:hypothetical protein
VVKGWATVRELLSHNNNGPQQGASSSSKKIIGMVRPKAWAVLRLMTNSNLTGSAMSVRPSAGAVARWWRDERRPGGAEGSSCGEPACLPERQTTQSALGGVSRLEGADYGVTIVMVRLSASVPEGANGVTAAVAGPAGQPGKKLVVTVTPS